MTLPGSIADGETLDLKRTDILVTIIDADAAGGDPSTGRSVDRKPKGSRVETFEVTGLTPGVYSVASTWRVTTLNAFELPVTIRNSAGGPAVRTLTANQLEPSNDSPRATTWHSEFEAWAGDSISIFSSAPSS